MSKVAALFIDPKGPYPALVGVSNCWDESRDARTYPGPLPVVAHPPCQLWTNFAFVNFKRWGGEHNRPGNDGGCFRVAVALVRRWCGVLEHPAFSHAWEKHGLSRPSGIGWNKISPTEWVCEVWQSAYGHRARKRTWLFYSGQHSPYEAEWGRPAATHQIGFHDQRGKAANKQTVSKREAIHSPPRFAEFLVCLAHRAAYGR